MGKMSRNKGARGERELAKRLSRLFDVEAIRGRQYQGSPNSPDVVTGIDGVHVECKRMERINVYDAMQQASDDAGDSIPLVAHRRNHKEWLAVIRLDDLPELCRILRDYERKD